MTAQAQGTKVARPSTGSDVAREAGVSKSAVSRAFTGGVVSPDARERILAAARKLRYRPSLTARSLTTSRSRLIGVAITHLDNHFYPEVIERLSDRLAQAGFRLVLFVTRGEADLDPVLDELLGFRLDGVILASSSMAARLATECLDARVPVIMFNNIDLETRAPGVSTDNALGASLVARFLLTAGHQRFGVVTGLNESSTSVERCDAFTSAIVASGLPRPAVKSGAYEFAEAQEATRALLLGPGAADALFCVNDHMALAALQAARELGLEPGRDVSIVGFDNVAISAWPAFSLTTYAQPVQDMVDHAVTRLVAAINGRPAAIDTVRLPGWLVVRRSARAPDGITLERNGETIWIDESVG